KYHKNYQTSQQTKIQNVLLAKNNSSTTLRSKQGHYSVQNRDTLYKISKKLKVPLRDLIEINRLKAPYILKVGQVLKLPKRIVHIVVKGQSLSIIAKKYQVSMARLARDNGLKVPWVLRVGQKLYVPARFHTTAKANQQNIKNTQTPRPYPSPSNVVQNKKKIFIAQNLPQRKHKNFLWPVRGKLISNFGPGKNGIYNDGINIAVEEGSAVHAAENGVVAYSGDGLPGLGNMILIRHADGYISAYAHNHILLVKRGQKVKRGQVIARAGSTGNVASTQLHFELRKGARALNPIKYLES
ncbi:MAG: M23 family metallopeptidase, partial [Pseudomonadota bacterium]